MAKQFLVVVESAAKAKTIEKFLGRGYTVRACMGHVRDLPTRSLGVDVENGFEPRYVVPPDRKEIVKRLKGEARTADSVLLATDPDREGEAIAWHLVSALDLNGDKPVSRIEFHEITKGAILEALGHPREIDIKRVEAQQARRVLDRLIGYPVSRLLSRKVRNGLTAGRVQSVAVRLVVERERAIREFEPVEYWSLDADLAKRAGLAEPGQFSASLTERAGTRIELHIGVEAEQVVADLDGAAWRVAEIKEREQQRHPAAPFTTSTLQQEASRKLNFTAKRTMSVAQQLYEGVAIGKEGTVGLITYMRTDSVTIAQSAQQEAREYIHQKFGGENLPAQPRVFRTRSRLAQEAHEAIRPTSVYHEPAAIKQHLSAEQFRLYELIWKRFVASQMASALFHVTTVEVDARAPGKAAYRFRATGSRLKFRGFLSLYLEGRDDDAVQDEDRQPLPALAQGEDLDLLGLRPLQHFTQPPPRFTEATLVKTLEEYGIGRPSTYAPTLSTIQDRGYVVREGKALQPTPLGEQVTEILVAQFGDIVNPDFTATMEEKLDEVAQGQRAWVPVVADFYTPLTEDLRRAETEVERMKPADVPTDEVCSQGHPMVIKEGRFGRFLACSLYPEHKESRPLAEELPQNAPEERCSHGELMQLRSGRFGPFYISTHECGETRTFAPRIGVACPKEGCGGDIAEKRSKKGRTFYGCTRWPECDWVSWGRPMTEPCPQCGGLQLDLGRDRVRCWTHEGPEPSRFAKKSNDAAAGDQADATASTRATKPRVAARAKPKPKRTTARTVTAKARRAPASAAPTEAKTRTAAPKARRAPAGSGAVKGRASSPRGHARPG
ncbi:MAG: type I DNA topoisomerase [Chloroflexi bacterium]|nr:type I DNA topoisomerase [Chloroflexota bacterium]